VNQRKIIAETLTPPPEKLGVTHWSSRLLASRLKLDHATVLKAWRSFGVMPWRAETFKFSTDPELVAKITDVIGLYLNPPENATVLWVDESLRSKPWTGPPGRCPYNPAMPSNAPTTTSGTALPRCSPRWTSPPARSLGLCKNQHRHEEFLAFLRHLARAYPEGELYLVMDSYTAHKRPEVKARLAANPRIRVHFTLNLRVLAQSRRNLVRDY
jgi:hypothetical protein